MRTQALIHAQLLQLVAVADELDLNANTVAWLWLKNPDERARWLTARRERNTARAMRRKQARRAITGSIAAQLGVVDGAQ